MVVIARVADIEITDADLASEDGALRSSEEQLAQQRIQVLNRLIDRCLLFHEASAQGILADSDEFDSALLTTLETQNDFESSGPLSPQEARQMEERITRSIVVKKYIRQLCGQPIEIEEAELRSFYADNAEIFATPEKLRISHILIKKNAPDSQQRAQTLRDSIHSKEDFDKACSECSDCPSNLKCGDLGYIRPGQLIPAMEDVAFSLKTGEISSVFSSVHGYHILMLTDRQESVPIPYEELKDMLRARLAVMKREVILARHIKALRQKYGALIQILEGSLSQAL